MNFEELHQTLHRIMLACAFSAYVGLAISISTAVAGELRHNLKWGGMPRWKIKLFRIFGVLAWIPVLDLIPVAYVLVLVLRWLIRFPVRGMPAYFRLIFNYKAEARKQNSARHCGND